jgi:hypothetical protein
MIRVNNPRTGVIFDILYRLPDGYAVRPLMGRRKKFMKMTKVRGGGCEAR